jgi:hypothetical protein
VGKELKDRLGEEIPERAVWKICSERYLISYGTICCPRVLLPAIEGLFEALLPSSREDSIFESIIQGLLRPEDARIPIVLHILHSPFDEQSEKDGPAKQRYKRWAYVCPRGHPGHAPINNAIPRLLWQILTRRVNVRYRLPPVEINGFMVFPLP